jgi:subtilisin family serine protease
MVSMPLATSPPVLLDGATASPPTDNYTTALAALIAGSSDHGFGGAAPGSPLLAISVLDENLNATNAAIAAGVDRAALGGARVTCLAHGSMERSEVIDDALADAVEAGVVVVAPAGNGGDVQPEYPAASAGVLSVGAVDRQRRLTPWTNRGPWVHVMAPGYEMFLPAGEEGYAPSQGTSRSCAIASGAVALLLQARPQLTPGQIRDLLVDTGQPVCGPNGGADGTIMGTRVSR